MIKFYFTSFYYAIAGKRHHMIPSKSVFSAIIVPNKRNHIFFSFKYTTIIDYGEGFNESLEFV